MKLTTALSSAARRVGMYKGLWALLWFAFTALSLIFAVPAVRSLGPLSRLPEAGPKYLPGLDLGFMVEWAMRITPSAPGLLASIVLPLIGVVVLVHVLVSGGAIYRLLHRGRVLDGASLYFWRFIRLALISLLFYGVVLALAAGGLRIAGKIWGEGMEAKPAIIGEWVIQALSFLLLGLVATIFDYAKVRLAVDGSRKTWRAAFASAGLVFKNVGKTMGGWAAVTAMGVLFFVLWRALENAVLSRTIGAVVLLIVAQQLYVISRIWIRLMYWGVAIELDGALRLPPEETALGPAEVLAGPPPMESGTEAEPEVDEPSGGEAANTDQPE
ncbi:MAG TPA: hypothetical protein PKJ41_15340 [Bryobacteraceae bacterium]|nr:hypothetical protein [Bryobacteraceae bacterium]